MASARPLISCVAFLCLATLVSGCRIYSRKDTPAGKPAGYPLARPIVDEVKFSTWGHENVTTAIEEELAASGAVGEGTGYTLRLRVLIEPESMSLGIDILNVLTVGIVPKIREHTLRLKGSYVKQDQELLVEEVQGKVGSWELWLPLLFWPPSWVFISPGEGSPEFVDSYREMTQQLLAALATKYDEVPEPTLQPSGTGTGPTVTQPAEQLSPCPICDEPRGRQTPCPHCGMD